MSEISIILPVYNCKAYLEKCCASVLEQTHRDLRLILVDDGSTDGSGTLCDAIAAKDPRVTVIHQENAGVSAARNAGLDAATGDYIGFVDADDYIDRDTYRIALAAMEGHDLVMWDAVTVWDDGRQEADTIAPLTESRTLTKQELSPRLLALMAGAVWRCLYRKELLAHIRFPVGIKLSEDRLFNLAAMGRAKSLRYLKQGLYYRYVRSGSAVNRYHGDKFEKSLLAMAHAKKCIAAYWDESYLPVYTKMFVPGGALDAIYEICSKHFPEKSRLAAIKSITSHAAVAEAFQLTPPAGLREWLLYKKWNVALLAAGIAFNRKNGC